MSRELDLAIFTCRAFFLFLLICNHLFVSLFYRVVVDTQDVFVLFVHQDLDGLWPHLQESKRLVYVERTAVVLFVYD